MTSSDMICVRYIEGEFNRSISLWRHRWTTTAEESYEFPPEASQTPIKRFENSRRELRYERRQILNRIYVEIDRRIIAGNLVENVFYEPRLAISTRCHQRHITPIFNSGNEPLRFVSTVAKIFWPLIALDDKRIARFHGRYYTTIPSVATKISSRFFRRRNLREVGRCQLGKNFCGQRLFRIRQTRCLPFNNPFKKITHKTPVPKIAVVVGDDLSGSHPSSTL